MKKLLALLMACLMLTSAAMAAEWADGLSAAKPYEGLREVDLTKTMGYIMLYPRTKLPAKLYGDRLQISLPRDDVELGEGTLRVYTSEGEEYCAVDFSDGESVEVRPLTEAELKGLIWGGGVCVDIRLPRTLGVGQDYYVLMDEGCFTAQDGRLPSLGIAAIEAWTPVVAGDYGVGGLMYTAPVEAPEPQDEEAGETEEAPAPEVHLNPEAGDVITFDLTMGGDAAAAVIFSENDSVRFDEMEYTSSAAVTGTVTQLPLNWGVVFLSESGEVLAQVDLSR